MTLPRGGKLLVSGGIVGGGASPAPSLSGFSSLTAYGNITGGNILTGGYLSVAGDISATGNVTGGNITTAGSGGDITLTGGNITGAGNISAGNVSTTGNITAANISVVGNVTAANVSANNIGNIASINLNGNASTVLYGNGVFAVVAGGGSYGDANVNTLLAAWGSNTVSTTGNVTAGYLFGNGSQLTGIAASYGNSNVVTFLAAFGSNTVSTSGNVTAGYFVGNGSTLTSITAANVTGTVANATYATSAGSATTATSATTAATVTTNAQPNITSVGTLSSISVTGNVTGGNVLTGGVVSATGNVTGGNLTLANGQISVTYTPSTITGVAITAQGANTNGGTGYFEFLKATNQSGGATNPNKSFRLNSTGGFEIVNSAYTATLFSIADNGNAVVQGNLQVTGTLTYVNTTNLSVTNALITLANAATTPAQANGGGIQLNGANANIIYTSGNDAWNMNKPLAVTGAITGTTTISAAGNITGGNVLTAGLVSATGNVTGNYVLGNGALLTGVITSVANINSGTSNVTVVSSGGNITVGVGGTSNVAVFATTGEYVTGVVSASGNVTGGNVLTGGIISSTGNITGGNLSGTSIAGTLTTAAQTNITSVGTLGALTVTANVTGGNMLTAGIMSSTGNITGGNISATAHTGTTVSVLGNVTGGNVLTSGVISATGNITGGNISATAHTGTTVSVTGNITAGNVINTGISSVTGNITAGNILTGGLISATGNITTANSFVGNLVGTTASVTGNVSAGNVIATNIIVNGQQTNYGVVTPAYMVVGQSTDVGSFGNGSTFILDTVVGNVNSQTSYNSSTGVITLTAGVTYDMSFTPSFITFTNSTAGYLIYQWVDATTNTPLDSTGTGNGTAIPTTDTTGQIDNATARVIYTPTTNQTVKLRVTAGVGTATLRGALGTQAVIKPLNPTIAVTANPVGFRATTPVTNVSVNNGASATMLFGTEEVDTNSAYNPATGRFTPNAAGYYSIDWFIVTSANGAAEILATLAKNGTDIAWGTNVVNATAHWNGVGGSAGMIYLNGTTDYINVKLTNNSGSTATVYSGSLSYFSAYLIR